MEQWSIFFTIMALAAVLLALAGTWWMVRGLRGRRSGRADKRSDPPRPNR